MIELIRNIVVGFVCFLIGCLYSDSKKRIPSDQPEIVQCKDCKHACDDIGGTRCSYGVCGDCIVDVDFWFIGTRRNDDFCSRGERKEDG